MLKGCEVIRAFNHKQCEPLRRKAKPNVYGLRVKLIFK